MSVQGPIARTIGDVRLGLQAMSRRSPHDPTWTNATGQSRNGNGVVKVGFSRDLFADGPEDDAITKAMDTALAGLRAAGIETVEIELPQADRAAELWGELLFVETDLLMGKLIHEATSADFQTMYAGYLANYRKLDFAEYLVAAGERIAVQRNIARMFERSEEHTSELQSRSALVCRLLLEKNNYY